VISVCIFLFFGIFTEILQALTFEWGGRRFEVKDYISDILGGCIGLLFLKIIEKKIKKRLQYEK
jgi:VanZ family protein